MKDVTLDKDKLLVIYGCGGHARSLSDVAISNGHENIIFVDENARTGEKQFGFDVVSKWDINQAAYIILALGDNQKRALLFQELMTSGNLISLVADSVHWGKNAIVEKGVFVGEGAHLGPNAYVDENTIINTHCVIEHDCHIGKHSHISVNATVAGRSRIGDFVMIGTGATVIDGITIASHVTVGAGATVIQDITEPGVYVGVPAKRKQ